MSLFRHLCGALVLSAVFATAQGQGVTPSLKLDIPSQPMTDALNEFARQSGLQVLMDWRDSDGLVSPPMRGTYTAQEALTALLSESGLAFEFLNERTVSVRARPKPTAVSSADGDLHLAQADAPRADPPAGDDLELEEVRVTGIPFKDANVDIVRTEDDVQPYYIFDGEEIARANAPTIEQFLRQKLTMNSVTSTRSQGGSSASSTVDLRGFGTSQTLILVNGRRTSGSNDQQFDLNAFSPSMIERLEVLPSSASAIYGGNAIGGVLNVVLKRDFTGGDVQLSYDTPTDTHAPVRNVSGGYGWSLAEGRTNVTLKASFRDSEPVTAGDRSKLQRRGLSRIYADGRDLLYSPGSPAAFGSTPNIASDDGSALVFKEEGPLGGTTFNSSFAYVPAGISPTTSLADLQAGLLANDNQQNLTPSRTGTQGPVAGLRYPLEPVAEARSVAGAVRHKINERLELIAEMSYNSDEALFPMNEGVYASIPASSPVNPFQQDVQVYLPLPTSFGAQYNEMESLRMVAGFVMDLPHEWRAQGDYTWNRASESFSGEYFDAVSAGVASFEAFESGALNPFVDTLAHPEAFARFRTPADRFAGENKNTLADIGLRLSGPVGQLPAGRPNLTIGLGRRNEKQPTWYNDEAGNGRFTNFEKSQRVSSVYGEALLPLFSGRNAVPGVRLLDLQLASRFEDFSVDSNQSTRVTFPPDHEVDPGNEQILRETTEYSATSVTAGLRYKPTESLTLRTSYATAFLPPRFDELVPYPLSPVEPIFGVLDPRRDNEQVVAGQVSGGNPDLKPLESETLNFGVLYEPERVKGLRLGIEWFRIDREDLIFAPEAQFLLRNEELYASRIVRAEPDPGDPFGVGPITALDLSYFNAEQVSTDGFDFTLGYGRETERHGIFNLDLMATVVESYTRVLLPGSPEEEIAGRVNGDFAPLKLRANATLGWERGPWSFSWTTLYYGSYDQWSDPLYVAAQGGTTVPHQIYHNVLAGYRFEKAALSGASVTLGVRNLFGTLPPFDAYAYYGGVAYSNFGDPRLRSVQLSISKRFE